MMVGIHPITLGVDNCYIIQSEGTIMIDGGAPKQAKRFMEGLESLSMKPGDIQLIVLTHGHWDHIGSAKEIKEITGAPIALHRHEKDCLEKSLRPLPPGVST
jgi:glyoxylase-like metal-dependent hydrolase (beta-lactamase superfamily II)